MDERAVLLRIQLGEAARHGHEALYKHLVKLLRERGLAGATAHRGVMGYGADDSLHATTPLRLSHDLPVVVEAVGDPAVVEGVLGEVASLVAEGLVTTQDVRLRHRPS